LEKPLLVGFIKAGYSGLAYAGTQKNPHRLWHDEYQLSNGLRVLYKQEKAAPVVAVCVTFMSARATKRRTHRLNAYSEQSAF